jgi:hypothetical protein
MFNAAVCAACRGVFGGCGRPQAGSGSSRRGARRQQRREDNIEDDYYTSSSSDDGVSVPVGVPTRVAHVRRMCCVLQPLQ